MSDIFLGVFNEDQLIDADRQICLLSNEPFGFDMEILTPIIETANLFDEIPDQKAKFIKKVANMIGGVVFHQPFTNGNKRTALAVGTLFFRTNGLNLPYGDREDRKILFELLEKTMFKHEGDLTIISDIEDYLIENVVET